MAGNVEVICPTTQAEKLRQTNTTGSLRMAGMRELPVGEWIGKQQLSLAPTVLMRSPPSGRHCEALLRRSNPDLAGTDHAHRPGQGCSGRTRGPRAPVQNWRRHRLTRASPEPQ